MSARLQGLDKYLYLGARRFFFVSQKKDPVFFIIILSFKDYLEN